MVLATLNQKFDKLLEKEQGQGEKVEIGDVRGEVLKVVVEHIYTGKVRPNLLNRENAKELLAAGELFQLEELKEEAAIFMAKHLDEENAIDVMTKDIFVGAVSNNAFAWVANNFQTFLDSDPLKSRLFSELGVGQLSHLLRQRGLMLWDKQGIYLPALLREKQLFSFVLAYVAHDKTTRLPDLTRLLTCLKLPLLIESQALCLAALAEGLDEKEEDLSEVLGELLDPWKDLQVCQRRVVGDPISILDVAGKRQPVHIVHRERETGPSGAACSHRDLQDEVTHCTLKPQRIEILSAQKTIAKTFCLYHQTTTTTKTLDQTTTTKTYLYNYFNFRTKQQSQTL